MAGLGFVLGGALQGFGQGLAAQGQQQWQERRDAALEKLRADNAQALEATKHQNDLARIDKQGEVDDWKGARQTARSTAATITVNNAETNNRIRIIGVQQKADAVLATIRAGLERSNNEASLRLRSELDGGNVDSIVAGDDGNYRVVFKNGSIKDTGVRATERTLTGGRSGDGSSIMDQVRGTQAPQAPPPTTTSAGKTATRAQLQELARQSGQTVEQAEAWAKANGFTIR